MALRFFGSIRYTVKIVLMTFLGLVVPAGNVLCLDVAVLVSSGIIPYTACVEGIRESLQEYVLYVATMDQDLERGKKLLKDIAEKKPRLIIAVGPQAAYLLGRNYAQYMRLFCMVLNPERLLGKEGLYPGVSLNINPSFQIDTIKKAFPQRTTIGVFYSARFNQPIIDELSGAAARNNAKIVPFTLNSPNDISRVIESEAFSIDVLLLIPDDQLRSTKIVEYIVHEALIRKIPVVGYNTWFSKNGALLSFVVDYQGVGRQTGAQAAELLKGTQQEAGIVASPEAIKVTVDLKTAGKLGVPIAPAFIQQADEVLE